MPPGIPIRVLVDTPVRERAAGLLQTMSQFLGFRTLFVALNDGRSNVIIAAINHGPVMVVPNHGNPLNEAYCRTVVEARNFVVIPNTATDPRTRALPITATLGPTTFVGVPVTAHDGRVIGTLCAMDTQPRALRDRDQALLEAMAELLGLVCEVETQAYRDPLTGVGNRRVWEWYSAHDHVPEKTVAVADLDYLKALNDRYGHEAGDAALQAVAAALQAIALEEDGAVSRVGGDEFVLLLPRPVSSADIGARLAHELDSVSLPYRVSATVGTASGERTWADLLTLADGHLLAAKRRREADSMEIPM